jgi:hypothetical protein
MLAREAAMSTTIRKAFFLLPGALRADVFAGECRRCGIAANTDVAAPRVASGHFDGTFVVRADGLVCVEWTSDACDPDAGGADCVGVCVAGAPQ